MKKLKDESGQALIISALCMTCLLGFVALAADVGVMLREKRLVQTAADAAAIAGALELNYSSGSITNAAQAAAVQNGFTTGSNGATVIVHHGPASGPHTGDLNYVEAIVSQTQPTLFMSLFGVLNMTPTARAVAQNGGSSTGCVYILAPTGTGMSLQGNFDLTAPNCGLIIDSSGSDALDFTGKAGTITAGSVGVVGGVSGSSSGTQPITGIVPLSDPLSNLIAKMPDPTVNPLKATCTVPNAGGKKGAGTLSGSVPAPAGGIACYSGDVVVSDATFGPGMYVFTGNVTLDGSVTTNGATLDLNSGGLTENTGTTLNLNPPPLGPTQTFGGISIMAPPTNGSTLAFAKGDATGTINGDIYAPGAAMTLQDHGGSGKKGGLILNTDLIVKTLSDTAADITINSFSQTTGASQLTRVTLVE
ncbi:MAG TPA: pilus assembly protein TadG-related protein [Edaphobacter sp.]|nr:pilus assembly protein TadG-related protein [Edaphobacter sp.]